MARLKREALIAIAIYRNRPCVFIKTKHRHRWLQDTHKVAAPSKYRAEAGTALETDVLLVLRRWMGVS